MTEKQFVRSSFEEALASLRKIDTTEGLYADGFYAGPTPEELEEIYSKGFLGVNPDNITVEEKQECKDFMASMPALYEIFPWAKGIGKGKVNAPYLATLKFAPTWGGDEAQTRGSCVSHGCVNAAEIDHGNDALHGETEWKGRLVKEALYRARGYNTDGWYCEAAAKYIGPNGKGGLLYRKSYEGPNGESVDFSNFSSQTEQWAGPGKSGVPAWLEEQAKKNSVKWVIPITTMEEYRDALAIGFGINVCSGYGYSKTTDEFGVASKSGSWAHAMAHAACIDTDWASKKYGNMLGLIIQSWGRWNKQNGKPEGAPAMPVGSFYVTGNNVAGMLKGGDSFALCGLWGFERVDWEAFTPVMLRDHFKQSDVSDYYKARQEKAAEEVVKSLDEGFMAL